MLASLLDQFGWFSLMIGAIAIWLAVKVVRKVFMTVLAFMFTLLGILRLWTFISTL